MVEVILNKAVPVLLGVLGVSCIDTPGNFVRTLMLDMLDIVSTYFQQLANYLG